MPSRIPSCSVSLQCPVTECFCRSLFKSRCKVHVSRLVLKLQKVSTRCCIPLFWLDAGNQTLLSFFFSLFFCFCRSFLKLLSISASVSHVFLHLVSAAFFFPSFPSFSVPSHIKKHLLLQVDVCSPPGPTPQSGGTASLPGPMLRSLDKIPENGYGSLPE